jgi:glycosyltransferase involved in cell wall biosynthesis
MIEIGIDAAPSKVVIIVPIYNDLESAREIVLLINQRKDEFEKKQISFLLVDNGSTDARIVEFGLTLSSPILMERFEQNLGFGGGILKAAKGSQAEWIGWMPGNLKVNPIIILDLLDNFGFKTGDVIKCKRIGRKIGGRMKTLTMGIVQSIYAGKNMMDTGGTPTICERRVLLLMPNPPTSVVFESFVLYWVQKFNLNLIRPKIPYGERKYGDSHWQNGLKSEFRLAREILSQMKVWKAVDSKIQ